MCLLLLQLRLSSSFLQLLGRADNVKGFIRRGETEGLVEITLASGNDRPIVVSRRIRTDEHSGGLSDWKLNGSSQLSYLS